MGTGKVNPKQREGNKGTGRVNQLPSVIALIALDSGKGPGPLDSSFPNCPFPQMKKKKRFWTFFHSVKKENKGKENCRCGKAEKRRKVKEFKNPWGKIN